MKTQAHMVGATLMLALLATTARAATDDRRAYVTPSEKIVEARMESQILTAFNMNASLRDLALGVAVDGTIATLGGTVQDQVTKELAGQIAMDADGVESVENRIAVDPRFVPRTRATGERSFGEKVDDATITAKIKSKLLWSSRTVGMDIHVKVFGGSVTLTGNAATIESRSTAARIARNTDGVNFLDNAITVARNPSQAAGDSLSSGDPPENASDAWISAKVKSSLMFTRGTDVFGITVSTLDGVVSLSGVVGTDSERTAAIQVAQDVKGVKQVDATGLKVG